MLQQRVFRGRLRGVQGETSPSTEGGREVWGFLRFFPSASGLSRPVLGDKGVPGCWAK